MKLVSRYFTMLTFISALFFTACDDDITRDPSPITNPSSTNVFFSGENNSNPILGINDTSFDVKVSREKTDKEQTVALTAENVHGGIFEIPSSVTFAAGEAQKNVTINVKDMELMKSYHLAISVDGEQTSLYSEQIIINGEDTTIVYPRIELNILKEDFAPYAKGSYSNLFFAPGDDYESWEATLEYSPATETYRFKNCWVEGYDVKFKWDGGTDVTMVGAISGTSTVVATGSVHPSYGMISAYYKGCTYNSVTKKFTFPITWRVSAGSFGAYNDYFTITQLL